MALLANCGLYLRHRALTPSCDTNQFNILLSQGSSSAHPQQHNFNSPVITEKPFHTSMIAGGKEFCEPDVPCVYPDVVDFRIIVMTYKRSSSLERLLKSVDGIVLNGDKAALEIFIDRDSKGNVHLPTVEAAQSHQWPLGQKRVHIWSRHVGLYGQWIDSWRPKESSEEVSLILEDDISVSKYCYLWIKAAHKAYGNRTDISGYTIQSDNLRSAKGGRPLQGPKQDTAFLYRILGSWGFSPHPRIWREFQDWFHEVYKDKTFHPYVNGLVMTSWYKEFEKSGREKSMWTMWFIWYTHKHDLFCLINNLGKFTGSNASALAIHRHEPGLHFSGKGTNNVNRLLSTWDYKYVKFPKTTAKLDYDAKIIG